MTQTDDLVTYYPKIIFYVICFQQIDAVLFFHMDDTYSFIKYTVSDR